MDCVEDCNSAKRDPTLRQKCVEEAILSGEFDSIVEHRCYLIKQKRYAQARSY